MIQNYHWVTPGPLSFDSAPMQINGRAPSDLLSINWDLYRAISV